MVYIIKLGDIIIIIYYEIYIETVSELKTLQHRLAYLVTS